MTTPELSSVADLVDVTGAWELAPERSRAEFRTRFLWALPVKGTVDFQGGRAVATVHPDDSGRVSLEGKVSLDVASVTTGNKRRDARLHSPDFFDGSRALTIEFVAAGARLLGPGRVEVEGSLIVNRMARPLLFEASVEHGGDVVTLDGEIDDLDRRQFGMDWAKLGASVHNRLIVHASFTRSVAA